MSGERGAWERGKYWKVAADNNLTTDAYNQVGIVWQHKYWYKLAVLPVVLPGIPLLFKWVGTFSFLKKFITIHILKSVIINECIGRFCP